MKVVKIQKALISLLLLSFLLPFIFQEKNERAYISYVGFKEGVKEKIDVYYTPNIELFWIAVAFLILWVLTEIWEKELRELFNDIDDETE